MVVPAPAKTPYGERLTRRAARHQIYPAPVREVHVPYISLVNLRTGKAGSIGRGGVGVDLDREQALEARFLKTKAQTAGAGEEIDRCMRHALFRLLAGAVRRRRLGGRNPGAREDYRERFENATIFLGTVAGVGWRSRKATRRKPLRLFPFKAGRFRSPSGRPASSARR